MRTTLTLDDDLAEAPSRAARLSGRSFKAMVNDTLRRGLAQSGSEPGALEPFVVEPQSCGWMPGIDPWRSRGVIVPDVNLHQQARQWWETCPDGPGPSGPLAGAAVGVDPAAWTAPLHHPVGLLRRSLASIGSAFRPSPTRPLHQQSRAIANLSCVDAAAGIGRGIGGLLGVENQRW